MVDTPFRLYTDGACRGNPGLGGIGVVFKDEQGNIVGTMKGFIGSCTNNEAEYQALIAGLKEAVRRGYSRLSVYMDSELVVKQINGAYRVKSKNLSRYFQEVKDLLSAVGSYRVFHVGRNENRLADQLANEAIDEHERSL